MTPKFNKLLESIASSGYEVLLNLNEGSGIPGYDIDPSTLSTEEISQLSQKERRRFAKEDSEMRVFVVYVNGRKKTTEATSKEKALNNILYRISDSRFKRGAAIAKAKRENEFKVKDMKWKVTYEII